MSLRIDTQVQVPSKDGLSGTSSSASEAVPGTGMNFAIGADESALLCGLLQAISAEADLEDPQLLVGLAEIGQLARRMGGYPTPHLPGLGVV